MIRSSRLSSNRGFSLVELMVVVAIIGILAAIAVPSVTKYMAKARQSEAKSNLSSLYTSEKAFFAEYSSFDSRFAAVGFTPEGQLRYDIGFIAVGQQADGAEGYHTPPADDSIAASAYCGTTAGTYNNGCTLLNDASGARPVVVTGACTAGGSSQAAGCITTANTFRAGAVARIVASSTDDDWWTIDDVKLLRNTQNGIP